MAKLGDICKFQSGGTPSKSNPLYFGGTIPWITTVALNGSEIGAKDAVEWITEKAIMESVAKIVPANSIMVGTRVGVGKVALNIVPMSTSQDIVSLLEIDESKWNKAFMCKWISSKSDYLQSQARGATIKGIKIETIAALEVPEISIKEQLSVSVCLDKVSRLISLRKQQLAKLDELVKARFVEMFGDPIQNEKGFVTTAGTDFLKLTNGKPVPDEKRRKYGIPVYGGNGISWYTDEILFEGDTLVVGRVGFQSGNVHYVKGPLWITDNAMYVTEYDKEKYDLIFLYVLMEHINFTRFQDAGDLKKITQKPFIQMNYICPPLALQKKFTNFAEQVDTLRLKIQQSLDRLIILKKLLMQEYFG